MSSETRTYEELLEEVNRLQDEGRLSTRPTREETIDWAYGNTKIENPKITMDIVTRAVDERLRGG
jgi:hypothetical protein